jgi:uncharacterized protein YukE
VAAADYDHVREIAIGPWGMNDTAKGLNQLAQNIADSIDRITSALRPLVLNDWQGATQQEAEDFNNRWLAVMGEVFGSTEKPDDGVLNAISDGIANAAFNYNKAEYALIDVWNQFAGKLPTANKDGNNNPPSKTTPPDEMDPNKTAITADYPPYA